MPQRTTLNRAVFVCAQYLLDGQGRSGVFSVYTIEALTRPIDILVGVLPYFPAVPITPQMGKDQFLYVQHCRHRFEELCQQLPIVPKRVLLTNYPRHILKNLPPNTRAYRLNGNHQLVPWPRSWYKRVKKHGHTGYNSFKFRMSAWYKSRFTHAQRVQEQTNL